MLTRQRSGTALVAILAHLAAASTARGDWASGRRAVAALMAPRLEASLPGPLPLFPATNWWNTDISAAPVDPGSDDFIDYVNDGDPQPLHPDFGGTLDDEISIYGFPYIVVDGAQAKKTVQFDEAEESDGVDHSTETSFPFYPIPDEAITQPHWIEGGSPGNVDQTCCQDRHMLILDRDNRHLYELYNVWFDGAGWQAYSGAFFDMKTNDRRPEGWTSADAAGLAIVPGLVRYDEVYGADVDEIRHAFRFTVRHTKGYVYPASHQAGFQDPSGAADGSAAAAEAGDRHLGLRSGDPEDLPRDEDLRTDRRRQRHRHVHQRHVGRAVGQRCAEPGVRRADGLRLRGHPAGLEAAARARACGR